MSTTLEGWDEIASHMKKCVRTVQRYAKRRRDPMPVYRHLGKIVAKADDLDAWDKRQLVHVAARAA